MNVMTKTYISFGLVILAIFEYYSAMSVFGRQSPHPWGKHLMKLHRICGYVFLFYMLWISWVCLDLMQKLATAGNYHLDARGFFHGLLAITMIVTLGLKISFIRLYRKFQPLVQSMGIFLSGATIVLWCASGLMFLYLVSNVKVVGP